MKPVPGHLGNAMLFALLAATITVVVVKLVTGLAFAPLAVTAVLLFVIAFALKVRTERMTQR